MRVLFYPVALPFFALGCLFWVAYRAISRGISPQNVVKYSIAYDAKNPIGSGV